MLVQQFVAGGLSRKDAARVQERLVRDEAFFDEALPVLASDADVLAFERIKREMPSVAGAIR